MTTRETEPGGMVSAQGGFGRIGFLTAEFFAPAQERRFRQSQDDSQRRMILVLCALTLMLGVVFHVVMEVQGNVQTQALVIERLAGVVAIFYMLFAALRRKSYRALDVAVAIFGALIVYQTTLLQEISDPTRIGLLARNLGVIAVGHILLPTRFVYSAALMTALAVLSIFQVITFLDFRLDEKISIVAVLVVVSVAGMVARWQREIATRRSARATGQSENVLSGILENVSQAVVMYDRDHRLVAWNKNYLDFADLGPDILQHGMTLEDLTLELATLGFYGAGDPATPSAQRVSAIFAPIDKPDELRLSGGRVYDVVVRGLDDGGVVVTLTDIAARKKMEEDLRQAKQSADAASQSKTEFLANMSHEFRTPLNAVIGFSEALRSGLAGAPSEKQAEYLSDISNSGEHLLSLINDLLDLSKIEAGKLEISPEEVDVCGQIARSLPFVKEQAGAKSIILRHAPAAELPPLNADPRMLRQMLVNLLSNAVKFSNKGGAIEVSTAVSAGGALDISVRDEGVGMAPEDIPKALTPFEQTQSGIEAGGTGLGLALVERMMKLHGGSLEITSARGEGTTATLRFPADGVVQT